MFHTLKWSITIGLFVLWCAVGVVNAVGPYTVTGDATVSGENGPTSGNFLTYNLGTGDISGGTFNTVGNMHLNEAGTVTVAESTVENPAVFNWNSAGTTANIINLNGKTLTASVGANSTLNAYGLLLRDVATTYATLDKQGEGTLKITGTTATGVCRNHITVTAGTLDLSDARLYNGAHEGAATVTLNGGTLIVNRVGWDDGASLGRLAGTNGSSDKCVPASVNREDF